MLNPWRVIVLLMVFAAMGHLNRVGISVAGAEIFIPKLGLSETQMGWVYTAFLITYTVGMLPGGWLIDRIGAVRALTLYGVLMGVCVACTGAVHGLATSFGLWIGLLSIRALAGISSVPLHPGAAHVISDFVPSPLRTTANGIITCGALVGIAFSYPIYGFLNDRIGWPWAFAVGGSGLLLFGILWNLFTRELVSQRRTDPNPAGPSPVTQNGATPSRRQLLGNRNLWLIAISYAAYGYFQYLFFYWTGYYFRDVLHVPETEARWITFAIMLSQGAGMAIGGFCTDAICRKLGLLRGRRTIVMTGMLLGGVFGWLGVHVTDQYQVGLSMAIAMAALGLCEGVFWTTATEISHSHRGFTAAFMNTGGNLGGLVSPVLTPLMAESLGWSGAIMVAAAIATFGGLIWFWIRPENFSPES